MVLPTISLALITFAAWSRFQRASMLEVLEQRLHAAGPGQGPALPQGAWSRHALRTALIPLTTVTALDVGGDLRRRGDHRDRLQLDRHGPYLLESVNRRRRVRVLAWLLVSGSIVIVFNLIADLLYAVLDPRIRYE